MNPLAKQPLRGPDRELALAQYRRRAGTYDLELALFEPIRWLAIDTLSLQTGETVLDVGCGTGLSLARLQQRVGKTGQVVGIEQCPEMISHARRRSDLLACRNVKLLCTPAEDARIAVHADAALLHFTHDILRSPAALDQVLRLLRPGARIVASGLQWAPPWALPLNLLVWGAALRSVSTLQGLEQPWDLLATRVEGLEVHPLVMGAVFLATGRCRSAPTA